MLNIGILFAVAFVLLSAFREVSFTEALRGADLSLFIVCAFVPVTVGALAWARAASQRWPLGASEWRSAVSLNLTTCAGWVATIFGLKLLENPVAFSCIAFGFIFTFTLLHNGIFRRIRPTARQVGAACVIAVGGLLASYKVLGDAGHEWTGTGLLLAFVASFFGAANNVISGQLSRSGIAPMRISSLRFLLVIAVTLVIWSASAARESVDVEEVTKLAMLGFAGIGLPLVFIQYAIAGIGATRMSLVTASLPLAVSVLQAIAVAMGAVTAGATHDSLWDVSSVAAVLVSIGVFWGFWGGGRSTPGNPPPPK